MVLSRVRRDSWLKVSIFGADFVVRSNHKKLGVGGMVYARRTRFEAELQRHFEYSGSAAFWDIGANYGFWTRFVVNSKRQAGDRAQVFAVEPLPDNLEVFEKNLRQEISSGEVSLFRCALGSEEGVVRIALDNDDPGSTHISSSENTGLQVAIATLDSLYVASGRAQVGLLKIDVEGYEYSVLQGASTMLSEQKPRVICELIEAYLRRAGTAVEDVFTLMGRQGYTGRQVLDDGSLHANHGFRGDGNYVFVCARS